MRVSLNWVKKYVDLPKEITNKKLSYDDYVSISRKIEELSKLEKKICK